MKFDARIVAAGMALALGVVTPTDRTRALPVAEAPPFEAVFVSAGPAQMPVGRRPLPGASVRAERPSFEDALAAMAAYDDPHGGVIWTEDGFRRDEDCREEMDRRVSRDGHYWSVRPRLACADTLQLSKITRLSSPDRPPITYWDPLRVPIGRSGVFLVGGVALL